jgi:hypothetical protein
VGDGLVRALICYLDTQAAICLAEANIKKLSHPIAVILGRSLNVDDLMVEWFGMVRQSEPPVWFGRLKAICSASRATSNPKAGTRR